MHQAADIRQKEEESQQKLFAATGGNGLILSQQTDTVGEDRLRQMQGELVKAEADRMEKEAQAEGLCIVGRCFGILPLERHWGSCRSARGPGRSTTDKATEVTRRRQATEEQGDKQEREESPLPL